MLLIPTLVALLVVAVLFFNGGYVDVSQTDNNPEDTRIIAVEEQVESYSEELRNKKLDIKEVEEANKSNQ